MRACSGAVRGGCRGLGSVERWVRSRGNAVASAAVVKQLGVLCRNSEHPRVSRLPVVVEQRREIGRRLLTALPQPPDERHGRFFFRIGLAPPQLFLYRRRRCRRRVEPRGAGGVRSWRRENFARCFSSTPRPPKIQLPLVCAEEAVGGATKVRGSRPCSGL